MENYEPLLEKLQSLMRKLRGLNASKQETKLRPVLRQTTRWSSAFNMLQRYFDLKDTINTMDDATAAFMPTRREENKLKGLLEELKAFESSSKKLQSADGLSLLDVRDIFDALIVEHPGLEGYLGSDAAIIHHPEFEDACVTVLMGKANSLTQQQRTLLLPFEAPATPAAVLEDKKLGFADRAEET
ncbi:hypothetical protein PR003_g3169 [Phytophthora rubi]|nr:hypothetical protein PR002_g3045 [Phytophthora rubi]KAE9354831.1 hypothetical protein PR003_g3169 [Phytophthora rubi]